MTATEPPAHGRTDGTGGNETSLSVSAAGQQSQPSGMLGRTVVVVLALLSIALVVAAGLALNRHWRQGSITVHTTGYAVANEQAITVDFLLSAPSGSTLECQVRAQASDGLDVGVTSVLLNMGQATRLTQRVTVPTRRLANQGKVHSCSLADEQPVNSTAQRPLPRFVETLDRQR